MRRTNQIVDLLLPVWCRSCSSLKEKLLELSTLDSKRKERIREDNQKNLLALARTTYIHTIYKIGPSKMTAETTSSASSFSFCTALASVLLLHRPTFHRPTFLRLFFLAIANVGAERKDYLYQLFCTVVLLFCSF